MFGPSGGAYDVYRDGLLVSSGEPGPTFIDLPGDSAAHTYRVLAVSADCQLDDGNLTTATATDETAPALVPELGNVLSAVEDAGEVRLRWTDDPGADAYEIARSDTPDFAAWISIGTAPSGNPGLEDTSAIALPGLHTYRVAQERCGVRSDF